MSNASTNSLNGNKQSKLLDGISDAKVVINLFLNNKFEDAKARLNNSERGIYQQLAHSTILFIQAMATIEDEHLELAKTHLRKTLEVCAASRRKSGFTEVFTKQIQKRRIAIYNQYTEEQAHAELCYAECLLQAAFLSMMQDEKFTSLVKCSLKIRQCYKCYKICWRILKYKQWEEGVSKSAFESGVHLGVGAFSLMISMLPRHVLKLLEFVGFQGDRQLGLEQLRLGAKMNNSLRDPLCALMLLTFYLYATHMLGDSVASVSNERPDHLSEAQILLEKWTRIYPESAVFLVLAGRYEEITGNLGKAIKLFEKSITSQSDWIHYHHICYWELVWCYALQADWLQAIKYTDKLAIESRWSPASYRYIKAAFLLQYMEDGCVSTPKTIQSFNDFTKPSETVDELLTGLSELTKRFGGRSLPIEKIALRKSQRYFKQNKRLTLPALELIFIWNGFKMIQSQPDAITTFIMICENKINELLQIKDKTGSYYDNYCLALMLKGVCLRCRGQPFQASMCFQEILQNKRNLKLDDYLLPYCEMELCQLAYEEGDTGAAVKHLENALSYKNYHLQSRLHFRIHEMDTKLNPDKRKHTHSTDIKKSGSENPISPKLLPNSQSISSLKSAEITTITTANVNKDSDSETDFNRQLFDDDIDIDLDDDDVEDDPFESEISQDDLFNK